MAPATTKLWVGGTYSYQAFVYKGTPPTYTDKTTIETGTVEILPDLTQATASTDLRSTAKINLDMLEASLSGNTSPDVMAYSIGGRSISKMSVTDKITLRSYWQTEYRREVDAEVIAKGLDSPRRIGVRFQKI